MFQLVQHLFRDGDRTGASGRTGCGAPAGGGPVTRLQIEAEGTTRAGPDAVWPLVADATRYAEWGPWDDSGYEPSAGGSGGSGHGADGPGHGVGAVRRIRYRRTTTVEQVLEVEEGRRIV